ncbi:MAG: CDP-glycerol glycerophosphotransferase family protein [Candidatus Rhabdochlamydia sp.]
MPRITKHPSVAGYLDGLALHHLDHLAPLCSLMQWPLILTDPAVFSLAEKLYPDLKAYYLDPETAPFEITAEFDCVLTTLPRPLFDEIFLIAEQTLNKRVKTIWLPHGHSDKGKLKPCLKGLCQEEFILVYGKKMLAALGQEKACRLIPHVVPIGNFRYHYMIKHQEFYQDVLKYQGIADRFILYAPTWKDAESSSSFDTYATSLMHHLRHHPLVIKLHPHLEEEIRVIQTKLQSPASVTWIEDFPPIYPLLQRATHLIGDFSSVGYDCLTFNIPMFFFNPGHRAKTDPGRWLHRYGETVKLDDIKTVALKVRDPLCQHSLIPSRQSLYELTFGPFIPWESYQTLLHEKVSSYGI